MSAHTHTVTLTQHAHTHLLSHTHTHTQHPPSQLGLVPLLQKLHGCVSQLEQFSVRVNDMPGRRFYTSTIMYSTHTVVVLISQILYLLLLGSTQRVSGAAILQHTSNQGQQNSLLHTLHTYFMHFFIPSVLYIHITTLCPLLVQSVPLRSTRRPPHLSAIGRGAPSESTPWPHCKLWRGTSWSVALADQTRYCMYCL